MVTDRTGKLGPYPFPDFPEKVADVSMPPLQASVSGEITASAEKSFVARYDGQVSDVWLSVLQSGKDDSNSLSIEADVLVNGTTCLTTKPKIAHVSGEASQQKTSLAEAADTGITASSINTSNSFSAGDVITLKFELTRTASPTTEVNNPVIVVEMAPDF